MNGNMEDKLYVSQVSPEDKEILDYYLRSQEDDDLQQHNSNLANVQHNAFLLLTWLGAGTPITPSINAIKTEQEDTNAPDRFKQFSNQIFEFAILDDLDRTCNRLLYLIDYSAKATVALAREWRQREPQAFRNYEGQDFYFTFGSSGQLFDGGWVRVHAINEGEAVKKFRAHYGPKAMKGKNINCAFIYDEERFESTMMCKRGSNLGAAEHEYIK